MPAANAIDDPWVSDYTTATKGAQNPAAAAPAAQADSSSSYDAAWNASPLTAQPKQQTTQPVQDGGAEKALTDNLGVAPGSPGFLPSDGNTGITGGANPTKANLTDYTPAVQAVQSASNPQEYLAKQDALARQVAADLQANGHQVSWKGSQLIVDGRPYEVGGQQWSGATGAAMGTPNSGESASAYALRLIQSGMDPQQATTQANTAFGLQEGQDGWGKTYDNGTIGFHDAYLFKNPDGSWGIQQRPNGGAVSPAGASGSSTIAPYVAGAAPNYDALWSANPNDTYTPGAISTADNVDNMPDFSYESLLADAQKNNPVQSGTDSLVNKLLANPESLDPHTVQMMEAKDAEEQQQAAQSQDQATKRFGFSSGLADSPWLASERAATARSADANIIGNRRNIEISAAQTNKADQRAAATIGAQYQGQRANQQLAAVNTAVSGALQKAAETRNRFQLNETLKEQAAQLNLSKDQLIQQFALGKIADLSKRYGIDVGAGIDIQKLSEQSDEFKQDLLFRLQSLAQQNDQFGANLGLGYDTLNEHANEAYWNGVGGS